MSLQAWVDTLDRDDEKVYVRQCAKFWMGSNGGHEPDIPDGISKSHAQVLKFHCQSLCEGTPRRRKLEELSTITFKASEEFHKELAYAAALVDVNVSIFIGSCILLAKDQLKANPKLINFFSDSVIPK